MIKFLMIASLLLVSCTDEARTRQTLESSGFTDITVGGYDPFACGEHDYYNTQFTAKNPLGKMVSGTVCCGALKSCTVRF